MADLAETQTGLLREDVSGTAEDRLVDFARAQDIDKVELRRVGEHGHRYLMLRQNVSLGSVGVSGLAGAFLLGFSAYSALSKENAPSVSMWTALSPRVWKSIDIFSIGMCAVAGVASLVAASHVNEIPLSKWVGRSLVHNPLQNFRQWQAGGADVVSVTSSSLTIYAPTTRVLGLSLSSYLSAKRSVRLENIDAVWTFDEGTYEDVVIEFTKGGRSHEVEISLGSGGVPSDQFAQLIVQMCHTLDPPNSPKHGVNLARHAHNTIIPGSGRRPGVRRRLDESGVF